MRPSNDTPRLAVVQRPDEGDDGMAVEGLEPPMPERCNDGSPRYFDAKFVTWETRLMFKVAKVVMRFEVVEPGEFCGRKLERHFRTSKLTHPPTGGREGRFVLNARSDLFALMVNLLDEKGREKGRRPDRVSLRALKHMLFRIRPRTVKHDHRQKDRPEATWYSVCGEIERGE